MARVHHRSIRRFVPLLVATMLIGSLSGCSISRGTLAGALAGASAGIGISLGIQEESGTDKTAIVLGSAVGGAVVGALIGHLFDKKEPVRTAILTPPSDRADDFALLSPGAPLHAGRVEQ